MVKLGLGEKQIAAIVGAMACMLGFFFAFIFTGIAAFATPGGFSSSINSIFPVLGGSGSSAAAGGAPEESQRTDNMIEDALNEVLEELGDGDAADQR